MSLAGWHIAAAGDQSNSGLHDLCSQHEDCLDKLAYSLAAGDQTGPATWHVLLSRHSTIDDPWPTSGLSNEGAWDRKGRFAPEQRKAKPPQEADQLGNCLGDLGLELVAVTMAGAVVDVKPEMGNCSSVVGGNAADVQKIAVTAPRYEFGIRNHADSVQCKAAVALDTVVVLHSFGGPDIDADEVYFHMAGNLADNSACSLEAVEEERLLCQQRNKGDIPQLTSLLLADIEPLKLLFELI